MALYLYAVCRPGKPAPSGVPVVGPGSDELETLEHGDVAAIFSRLPEEHVRMTPDNLEAHQLVVEEAARSGVVLPFRFGMVVPSERELVDGFLAPRGQQLAQSLDALDGMVEVRIVGRYRGDAALADVVRGDARLRRMHERINRRPAAATYYDRINLGEQVMAGLERVRERDAALYAARLRPHVVAQRSLALGGEEVAFRTAYLVDRRRMRHFEEELSMLGDQQRERMELTLIGPLAPWDFAEIDSFNSPSPTRRGRGRGDGAHRGDRGAGAAWAS
jgi:hypothetical protein